MNNLLEIICLVVVIAIVFVFITYQRIDKKRVMTCLYMDRIDDFLTDWFDEIDKLFDICGNTDLQQRHDELICEYQKLQNGKLISRVGVLNSIYACSREAALTNYTKTEVREQIEVCDDKFRGFYDLFNTYNRSANAFNNELSGKFTASIAKLFRMNQLDVLDELYLRF